MRKALNKTDRFQTYQFSIKVDGGTKNQREKAVSDLLKRIQESIPTQVGKVEIYLEDFSPVKWGK